MRKWMAVIMVGVLAIGGVGYWGYQQYRSRELIQTALVNNYNRAFYNTVDHVQNLEVLLAKSLVASDRRQDDKIFTEIWQQTTAALDNLTQLPVSDVVIGRTAKFVTQLGDFSRNMAENATGGKTLTAEQYEKLEELYRQAGDLNGELQKVESDIIEGKISFAEMIARTRASIGNEGKQLAGANFQTIDEKMNSYPTLIYDGPFSDHLAQRTPREQGDETIDESQARNKALDFVDGVDNKDYVARVTGEVEGNIPAYRVELTSGQNGDASEGTVVMDVSRQGGRVIWSISPRDVGEAKWDIDRAREKALQFLDRQGYQNMTPSYHQKNEGVVTFNFVPREKGIIIYPDMVKVSVALDNGDIVGTDARGYIMNHHDRDLPAAKLSEKEARDLIGRGLQIEGEGRLALIPTETFEERLTWEFKGEMQGNTFLVYINAVTGEEERILQLFQDDNGTLTM